jgi:hypothetical protein
MAISVVSLVVGIMCGCLVTAIPGIMAVVQASKVNGLAAAGNVGGAHEAAAKARKYAIIGFIVTAVAFVLIAGIYIAAFALSDDNTAAAIAL